MFALSAVMVEDYRSGLFGPSICRAAPPVRPSRASRLALRPHGRISDSFVCMAWADEWIAVA